MLTQRPSLIDADIDEGIADLDDDQTTSSVRSSVYERREEYGRLYSAYKDGMYHRPTDEAELERLDIAGAMLMLVNDDRLHLAPLDPAPTRVLDIGAGTGIWCIDMGDAYPEAEVIGVDISPSMSLYVPPNVRFEIDDVEEEWTFRQPFDYIHSRYMIGSIRDWQTLLNQCYANVKPGGWVEFQDFDFHYYSQDGSLTSEHAIASWEKHITDGVIRFGGPGRTPRIGIMLEGFFQAAGFQNISVVRSAVPVGPWPKDPRLKKIGLFNWTQLYEVIPAITPKIFIGGLKWKPEEVEALMMDVRSDFKNRKIHMLHDVYSVWGQRPFEPEPKMQETSEPL